MPRSMHASPAGYYRQGLAEGSISTDIEQEKAVQELEKLYQAVLVQDSRTGVLSRLFGSKNRTPGGVYLYGGVGRGKTWLMDRFYQSLPFRRKRRVHFHRFMRNIHACLDKMPQTPDPLPILATSMAREYRVLCVDEFHVQDIADAMLMSGLLHALFNKGITLLFTSNLKPDELYRGGLQRDQFMPAIHLIEQQMLLCNLGTGQDYRRLKLLELEHYHVLDQRAGEIYIEKHLADFDLFEPETHGYIEVNQRRIPVKAAGQDLAWFDFMALCASARSPSDYMELASEYHMIMLSAVRQLNDDLADIAKRFIHLIDALYDHRVKLLITAEVPIQSLYQGKQLREEFRRTESRLYEMGSAIYYEQAHRI